ncbi:hypothetical protein M948_20930 [Virgibacillus sp. CM-4]|uniref:DUF948 domain-containing protein n=1 Tax=Virgibacillus sp. CM-4 TaxID=1354277 RepID=UPI0003883B53|nr:DUF948 domain-containing protein [Virgibacillus sp. CM-4]EQB34527.1 hypothetical protein M948_20930 [Virgibacillus sp. CM-4]
MDWLGIGVSIIGVALLILVLLLIRPLNKLAAVLSNLQKSTKNLPNQVEDLTSQARDTLSAGNDTLQTVNKQVKELSPIFYMLGNATRAANHASSSMADVVMKVREDKSEGNVFTSRNQLEGLYGMMTLVYFMIQTSKNRKTIDMS